MKRKLLSLGLLAAGLLTAGNVMADDITYEEKLNCTFDNSETLFTSVSNVTVANATDETLSSNVVTLTGSASKSDCYATFDISDYTSGATNVKIEFDSYFASTSAQYFIGFSVRDKNIAAAHGDGYKNTGAYINFGNVRANKTDLVGVNNSQTTGAALDTWYHVVFEIDLAKLKCSYAVTKTDGTSVVSGSSVAFLDATSGLTSPSQIEFYYRCGTANILAKMDNLVISTYTDESMVAYTVNAVDGSNNVIKKLQSAYTSDGTATVEGLSAVLTDDEGNFYLKDDTTTFKASFTGITADNNTLTVPYTKQSSMVFYKEGESFNKTSGTTKGDYSGGSYVGYVSKNYATFTVPATGTYKMTAKVVTRNTASTLGVYGKNTSTYRAAVGKGTSNTGVGNQSVEFYGVEGETLYIGSPTYNSLSFDYVFITQENTTAPTLEVSTAKQYVTYCNALYDLDFSKASSLEAYAAAVNDEGTAITLTKVDVLPQGAAVVLYAKDSESGAKENIPLTYTANTSVDNNELIGVLSATTVYQDKIVVGETETSNTSGTNYILQNGTFYLANSNGNTLKAGKAYLQSSKASTSSAKGLPFAFEGTTGINEISSAAKNGKMYNLQGVEVNAPAQGLYIMNGKKVIVK